MGFRVQGSEFRVQGSGFRVQGSGFMVQGSGFMVQGSGFRVQGSGFRVQGSGFMVYGSGFTGREGPSRPRADTEAGPPQYRVHLFEIECSRALNRTVKCDSCQIESIYSKSNALEV